MIPKNWKNHIKKADYQEKDKRLIIQCIDKDLENLLILIAGNQIRKRGLELVIDLRRSKNVEDMVDIIDIIHTEK